MTHPSRPLNRPADVGRTHGRRAVGVLLDRLPGERPPVEVRHHLDAEPLERRDLLVVVEILPIHGDVERPEALGPVGKSVSHVLHAAAVEFAEDDRRSARPR